MTEVKKEWSPGDIVNASDLNENFNLAQRRNVFTLVAGVILGVLKALVIGEDSDTALTGGGTGTNYSYVNTNYQYAQKITTPSLIETIDSVTKWFNNNDGSGVVTITCEIFADSGGEPTGSALASAIDSHNWNVSRPETFVFTFGTPLEVDPSTDYHIVWSVSAVGIAPIYMRGDNSAGQGANISTNGGSSWSASNGAFEHSTGITLTTSGKVYLADASANDFLANNFIGFTSASVVKDANSLFITDGVVEGFTGLTVGATYYLSDTAGEISASAGSQSRPIGIAISTTQLLIKHDNS